jgi:Tol biopolymer transport system component
MRGVSPRLRVSAVLVVATAALLAPTSAQATLVFTRSLLNPTVWVANDNGSGAHTIAKGSHPRISPDGQTIAFERRQKGHGYRSELMVVPADGSGAPRALLTRWRESFVFDWSPDSSTIAAVTGPELGSKSLVTIDVASGVRRTIANGVFSGVSFSPEGGALAYSKASSERYPPRSDVYRFDIPEPGTVFVQAPRPVRLTTDHRSLDPLWGPNETIVFVKLLGAKHRKYGPKNDLFLMDSGGGHVQRLTRTKVEPLLSGLSPTQWSADGSRLLAEFGGQDTTYAITVNPQTGAERALTKEREVGFVGTALSTDGSTVLGSIGGFEPGPGHKVVTIPYTGGRPKVLAANASEPDWSR